jgi:ankyrin repeat protein
MRPALWLGFWLAAGPLFAIGIHNAVADDDVGKVKALLKADPELVHSKAGDGATPLHVAAESGYEDVAQVLLAGGAVVDARDVHGDTPLHLAASKGQRGMAELLLAHGAAIEALDTYKRTPLHAAAAAGFDNCVALLLARQANVNAKADDVRGDVRPRHGDVAVAGAASRPHCPHHQRRLHGLALCGCGGVQGRCGNAAGAQG